MERKINALREKNRLYDLLQRQLAPQIIRMDQLLTRYRAAPEEEKRQLLGQVAVLGAYLKRGANLMFLPSSTGMCPRRSCGMRWRNPSAAWSWPGWSAPWR